MGGDVAGQERWAPRGRTAAGALAETWGALAAITADLSDAQWAEATECPGWDVKDQLSHVIAIERLIMGDPAPAWDEPLGDHVRNAFGARHEPWIAVRRSRPGSEVRAELLEVTAARLAWLEDLGEEGWATVGPSPVGEVPYAVFMEVRAFDCWVHEQDVRRALGRPGGLGNRASAISLDRMVGTLPFVVGKQAACADGTVVRVVVDGPGADGRACTIAVEGGRARSVDDEVVPTVTLRLSAIELTRLACGRARAEEVTAAGAVVMEGDAAVGRRVLGAMNVML